MRLIKLFSTVVLALGLLAPVQAKMLYKEKFNDWRDEGSNPGFNATFESDSKTGIATLKTDNENNYGKVMSAEEGITINIDKNTELQVTLVKDVLNGNIKINLMTAGEPYDSHEIIPAKIKKGTYRAKIEEKTSWKGEHSFWIEIWIEGYGCKAQIKNLKFINGKKEAKKSNKKKRYKKKRNSKKKI